MSKTFIYKITNKIKHTVISLRSRYYKYTKNYKNLANLLYCNVFGHNINWNNPEDLNQWINWFAFFSDTSKWHELADKYLVRKYVENKGYGDSLVKLLAIWEHPEDINFDNLPNQFVLKINNGSGDVRIIKNKNNANINDIKKYYKALFRKPFGKETAEPHYLKIKPLILAEELLDATNQAIPSESLIDYKFFCVYQKVEYCLVINNRNKNLYHTQIYHLPDWELCPEMANHDNVHPESKITIPKPKNLEKMINMCANLTEGFPFVRVDFYEIGGKVYFGELTFTPGAGRMTSLSTTLQKQLGINIAQNRIQS